MESVTYLAVNYSFDDGVHHDVNVIEIVANTGNQMKVHPHFS